MVFSRCVTHRSQLGAVAVIALSAAGSARALDAPPPVIAVFPPRTPPSLRAVRTLAPPVLDGRLDDPVWQQAPPMADFAQTAPYGGAAPSVATTVRVLYDDHALYVGFDCTQPKGTLFHRLTRRDEVSESDWVWINVDSRRDGRTASFFAVNVSGVVADLAVYDGGIENVAWDENWEASAAETPTGWSAELRIPLQALRFDAHLPLQSWGFRASRYIAFLQERDDWPYIPRELATPIPYFARLDDLRDLKAPGPVELRPFAVGQLRYRGQNPDLVASGFDYGASGGVDLKLHLTQTLTADASVNPDFAQVEADQLTLNLSNVEILYPEKRPLFLEGAEQYATPLALFYSRRIGSSPATPTLRSGTGRPTGANEKLVDVPRAATIYGALKLAGRIRDAWTVGTLTALASRNDYDVDLADGTRQSRTVEPLTLFNVLRLRREIGDRAQLGLLATAADRFEHTAGDRTCPNGSVAAAGARCFRDAYVGGVDGLWRTPGTTWVATGQLAGGVVEHGATDTQADGTEIRPGDRGLGGSIKLAKDGGPHVVGELGYTGMSRRFTFNDLGFMLRQNLHELKGGLELRTLDPGPLTFERHARLDVTSRRNLDGVDLGTTTELGIAARFRNYWYARAALGFTTSRFDDREFGDGSALQRARYVAGKAEIASDLHYPVVVTGTTELRLLDGGYGNDSQATIAFRILPQLEIDLVPQLSWNKGEPRWAFNHAVAAPATGYVFGRLLARNIGAILRGSYTFTPHLSLQAYAQLFLVAGHYSDFSTAPATPGSRVRLGDLTPLPAAAAPGDADFEQAALNVNVVLRWEYRLGSTFFLVYSRSQLPDVSLGPGEAAALRANAIGRVPVADTLLAKLSLWWGS